MKGNSKWLALVFVALIASLTLTAFNSASAANPDATTWIPDSKVYGSSYNERRPSITTEGSNTLWAAFEYQSSPTSNYGIRVCKSTDGGVTWNNVFGAGTSATQRHEKPSIAVDPYTGYAYVVQETTWTSDGTSRIGIYWYDGVLYTKVLSNHDYCHNPQIVCSYDEGLYNDLYVVYEDEIDNGIWFTRSLNHDMNAWSTPVAIDASAGSEAQPSIAYAPNGDLYVAYTKAGTPTNINVARSTDDGDTWTIVTNVDGGATNCYNPSVIATHSVNPVVMVAYENIGSTTGYDIRYSFSRDMGISWSKNYQIAITNYNERYPHLAIDGMGLTSDYIGDIHVTYWSDQPGPSGLRSILHMKCNAANPLNFGNVWRVSDDDADVSGSYPNYADRAITTRYNVPVVVWTDYRLTTSNYDVMCTTQGGEYIIDTRPGGLRVSIDGTYFDAPQTRYWPLETTHTLITYSQDGHPFVRWSDGTTSTTNIEVAQVTGVQEIIAYFGPTLTLTLTPSTVPDGSSFVASGQLTPGFATTISLYYRSSANSAWKKATSISTNSGGSFSKNFNVPVGTPAQTVDMVVVWFDSNTNRYAASNIAKLTIT